MAIHAEVECDVFSMENIYNLVITGVRVEINLMERHNTFESNMDVGASRIL